VDAPTRVAGRKVSAGERVQGRGRICNASSDPLAFGCDHSSVRVVASDSASELIQAQGGRLYVWLKRAHCCGNLTTLATASEPPAEKAFRQVDSGGQFELYVPTGLTRLPDELHLDVGRRRSRVEAYWDGCAWVLP